MATLAEEVYALKPESKPQRFIVRLAETAREVEQCLRLRYDVFATEMGASLSSKIPGIDTDRFDAHCLHLMVLDTKSERVIATTRLLTSIDAQAAGGFYSETEFKLDAVLSLPGNFMEVGRTCIHADFRRGSVLAILWQGIASVVLENNINYLIGCASIPLHDGDTYINSVMHELRKNYFSAVELRATPKLPLPKNDAPVLADVLLPDASLPPLLRGYLRQGAVICGEPYWDAAFHVADVFVLLSCDKIAERYQRHFIQGK